jgi:hypothetical protein
MRSAIQKLLLAWLMSSQHSTRRPSPGGNAQQTRPVPALVIEESRANHCRSMPDPAAPGFPGPAFDWRGAM